MDQDTRNKLQRATQQIRKLLEDEFAEQLEGTFDILPNGKILESPGKHLNAREHLLRRKLIEAIEHIKAGGKNRSDAVDEYRREAAFTFLNRFVALRMLETRGLLQECVSKGDASSGFKEFCGLAPGISSSEDGGYRLYLECLFDELTVEIKVLFDRRDPASLLWPRRPALNKILSILGQADLTSIWQEDETIGWVYQYFNSSEERRRMREESQTPRNSRELAVRNQFFTPRYVVEFLTDNTLGRAWYEMRKGKTRLATQCKYMLRRPHEVFLDEGMQSSAEENESEEAASQEDLLNKTVYILHRAKSDPRDLKILDPACGSGHFLLYAFSLLTVIYEEGWHDNGVVSEATGRSLDADYPSLSELYAAVPSLILAHNLHGIDIDPRAAQIAALALWMRSQRYLYESGVLQEQRAPIVRSNIVCAEPMPGEATFLEEFIAKHLSTDSEGRFLANLVRKVFESLQLAGEAGSLLRIEEDIAEVVEKAKLQWQSRPQYKQQTLFEAGPNTTQQGLALSDGIRDESFWEEAERRIYEALESFSEFGSTSEQYQRRLFASDTARGFSLIEVLKSRFDVVLMNPPFGLFTGDGLDFAKVAYKNFSNDMYAAFVGRGTELLKPRGRLGVLSSRLGFFLHGLEEWRSHILLGKYRLTTIADLGYGVLDAMVETAAYVIEHDINANSILCLSALNSRNKDEVLLQNIDSLRTPQAMNAGSVVTHDDISSLPGRVIAYWLPPKFLRSLKTLPMASDIGINVYSGLQTDDDFRFLRLWWEVPNRESESGKWRTFAKGGDYAPYADDYDLVVNWDRNGREMKAFVGSKYTHWSRHIKNTEFYGTHGLTYTERTTSDISVRVFPPNAIFSVSGPVIQADCDSTLTLFWAVATSRIGKALIEMEIGSGDSSRSGTAARHYRTGILKNLRMPRFSESDGAQIQQCLRTLYEGNLLVRARRETHRLYVGKDLDEVLVPADCGDKIARETATAFLTCAEAAKELDDLVCKAFGLSAHEAEQVAGPFAAQFDDSLGTRVKVIEEFAGSSEEMAVSLAIDRGVSGRLATKKTYFFSRQLELACLALKCSAEAISQQLAESYAFRSRYESAAKEVLYSLILGYLLGRWDPAREISSQPLDLWDAMPPVPAALSDKHEGCRNVIVDDVGHPDDFESALSEIPELDGGAAFVSDFTPVNRKYFATTFFKSHISDYSSSRRKSPIYWQIATPSSAYSVWLYYQRLNRDTFFKVLKEHVKPKLDHEKQKLERARREYGTEPTRLQMKEIEEQEKFAAELTSMVEEVGRIAPLWNPNLNDGVIINFSLLWRLVPQNKSWQKECKSCWDKLVRGDYDWAHLAMHLWPERVVPKCVTDASLAIAHGLEEVLWERDDRERFKQIEEPEGGWKPVIEQLVKERSSPAVKAALQSLLDAPVPSSSSGRSKRRSRTS